MQQDTSRPKRSWPKKFRDAFRGARLSIAGQSSFRAHFFFAAAVIVAGAILRVTLIEWCLLLLCIAVVLAAEMFNTALESIAKAITHQDNPHLGKALDVGSAAVLVASLGAAAVGSIIFLNQLVSAGWLS